MPQTRTGHRYLKLEQQLAAGVAAAGAVFDAAPRLEHESQEAEVMPSLPEAMALVAGAEEDKEVSSTLSPCTMTFGSTAKVSAECKLKY